jgi:hypothetical protein
MSTFKTSWRISTHFQHPSTSILLPPLRSSTIHVYDLIHYSFFHHHGDTAAVFYIFVRPRVLFHVETPTPRYVFPVSLASRLMQISELKVYRPVTCSVMGVLVYQNSERCTWTLRTTAFFTPGQHLYTHPECISVPLSLVFQSQDHHAPPNTRILRGRERG